MPQTLSLTILLFAVAAVGYTYIGYPVALSFLGRLTPRGRGSDRGALSDWPSLSICVPVYNEEEQVGELLRCLGTLDYPRDRLQIMFVSDASTDGTDEIVSSHPDPNVELLRMPKRGGKTRAENEAARRLTGEVVVNMDASVRVQPDAVKRLVTALVQPDVGCASGRDIAVSGIGSPENLVELGYVGYEMAVRDLETRFFSIVGASGCFYAVRRGLHNVPLPDHLDRDFAAALHAVERGYRAVSVPEAVCTVRTARSPRDEYRRKVRTIARGMRTLWYKRSLLDPRHVGAFSWMLLSHKVLRWLTPWLAVLGILGLIGLAPSELWVRWVGVAITFVLALAALGWLVSPYRSLPVWLAVPTASTAANLAAMHALFRALDRRRRDTVWQPTSRRP